MRTEPHDWEKRLIARAHEPLLPDAASPSAVAEPGSWDGELVDRALEHCAAVTREHSRTFYLASGLLPQETRSSVRALYASCRTTDDLVDRADGKAKQELEAWRRTALSPAPPEDDLVAVAWAHTVARHGIPTGYAQQLVDGVARDLTHRRYESFDDLADYSYGVASTVGLMAMHIIGFSGPQAIPFAVRLGVALQLTNILRDVGEDWAAGRLYLPLEELDSFGLSEKDIAEKRVDER